LITPLIAPVALALAPAPIPIALPTLESSPLARAAQAQLAGADAPPAIALPPLETAQAQPSQSSTPQADRTRAKGDPLEGFNRAMFGVHQAIDGAVLRPAALGYKTVVPKPLRSGFRNALSNLTEPFVFLNFLLQGKPGKAGETVGRFLVNSTIGVGGLFDVAKDKNIRLPHRNNGFGTTLAFYGVGPGPYLFLPLMGPMTLRDALGKPADDLLLPLAVGHPFDTLEYQLVTGVVGGLDQRAEADPELRALFSDAIDRYATLRSVYLQNRAAEIDEIKGKKSVKVEGALPELDDPLSDPEGGATSAPAPSSDALELQDPLADPAAEMPAQ
jgi:phospholipid-binding lipoprotein MlaA